MVSVIKKIKNIFGLWSTKGHYKKSDLGYGNRYKGEIIYGTRHGYGICNYANKDCYTGIGTTIKSMEKEFSFIRNKNKNKIYTGDCQYDKCHGYGSLIICNGKNEEVRYTGKWENGEICRDKNNYIKYYLALY